MIVDLRIYTCRPNHMGEFVKLYEELGWPLQKKYLGNCLGWYTTVEGAMNTVVHLWGYDSQADREARRSAMMADPAWSVFVAEAAKRDLLVAQENRILKPTAFSPNP